MEIKIKNCSEIGIYEIYFTHYYGYQNKYKACFIINNG